MKEKIMTHQSHMLVMKTFIHPTDTRYEECVLLCRASRMLRNVCLYDIRQQYFETHQLYTLKNGKKEWLFSNTKLYHQFKDHMCFRTDKNPEIGKLLPTKVMKQVYISLQSEFRSYIESNKSFFQDKSKFMNKPKLPNYKHDLYITRFPKDALSFKKKGFIHLSMTNILIPIGSLTKEQIRDVVITPSVYGVNVQISYTVPMVEMCVEQDNITNICGIDLGLNNLATLTSNDPTVKSIIINGRPVKSINQYFNKKLARLQSQLPSGITTSKNIKRLVHKRKCKIEDYLHKASSEIISHLLKNKIHCLVVGSNKHWKTNIKLGKRTNQNFVGIPFYRFKQMLQYKCQLFGIYYIEREESYTSKCSFLDLEDIKKHETYMGRRIRRGLFKSATNVLINADVNGSYNIIRKEYGNQYFTNIDKYTNVHIIKCSF